MTRASSLFDPAIVGPAALESVRKLDPRRMARNPVMFVVEIGSALVTVLFVRDPGVFAGLIAVWLWFTVLFANLAEAMAEGRGKAQAAALRRTRSETIAHRRRPDGSLEDVPSSTLQAGDELVVSAGEVIPSDGDVIEGIASVDESAITGESAPVIRESGGDRSAVTGGTRVLSDEIVVRVTSKPGESFLDRMIALVEGASRQKTPNEIALDILLAGLTIIFLLLRRHAPAVRRLLGRGAVGHRARRAARLPDPDDDRRAPLRDRDRGHGPARPAQRPRAVGPRRGGGRRLLDVCSSTRPGRSRSGTGRRPRSSPCPALTPATSPTPRSSRASPTRRPRVGRSSCSRRSATASASASSPERRWSRSPRRPRMSGVELDGRSIRKGAGDAVRRWIEEQGGSVPEPLGELVAGIARDGGTPLVVAENGTALGVVQLKDVVKEGIRERFEQLRRMGIRTVMITGDNPLTAKAIADEAGVDDFLAEATPEDKMALIRREQAEGALVAMTGDGTNDAPALAQADVGVAMNTGTQAAKEAGNMVDLDSNPTKLIDIVEIGKQLLITRGSLTTFSIANDVAKYFAIIPAMFAGAFPALDRLNVMALGTPQSAILSAVIFNALIIVALIPLALRGVRFRAVSAAAMLRRNLLVYGLGGIVAPFVGIKLIDLVVTGLGIV